MPNGGPQLVAKLSLDPAAFEKNLIRVVVMAQGASAKVSKFPFKIPTFGITAATKALRGFAATLASIGKGGLSGMGAGFLMGGWQGIGASIAGIGHKMVTGVGDAYEYGREMMNVSRATGIAAGKMAEYDLAMKDSQIETAELIMSVKFMDQMLLKAAKGVHSAQTSFEQLGLNYKELIGLAPEEAFERVGKAVAGVENGVLRGAGAIGVFGRNGAKMLKMFERGGAMEMAKEALGGSSGIIGKDGGAFEKVAIRLSHIGVKVRQIFLGVADIILPMVEKFTDKFHKMDFTDFGKKLGAAINDAMAWVVTFWREPKETMGYFWEVAKAGVFDFGNAIMNVMVKAGQTFASAIAEYAFPVFDVLLAAIGGAGIAKALVGPNLAAIAAAPVGNRDFTGAAAQHEKANAARPTKAFEAARTFLGQGAASKPDAPISKYAASAWRFGGIPSEIFTQHHMAKVKSSQLDLLAKINAPVMGDTGMAYRGAMSLTSMRAGAYDQSPLLHHRELRKFRNSAIAARSGRMLAAGLDPSKLGKDEVFDPKTMRRPGETANGDKRRAQAFAREVARREANQGTDNKLLGDIARNTQASAKNTAVFAQ